MPSCFPSFKLTTHVVVEKHPEKTPPICQYDAPEPLRKFISLPQDTPIVLGPRRTPPLPSPASHTNTEISLLTSVGFKSVSSEYYAAAVRKLQPDIVVGMADIPFGQESIGIKRKDKMSDRTETWLRDIIAKKNALEKTEKKFNIIAPILPIERDLQSWYLEHLLEDMVDSITGVAIYDAYLLDDLPEALYHLPRLSFHVPTSPHEVLRQVSLGMDILTIPFIADATDAGIALDFTFPPPADKPNGEARQSLGLDMWDASHSTSVTPLSKACPCYACTSHHRAYIQHLLSAKPTTTPSSTPSSPTSAARSKPGPSMPMSQPSKPTTSPGCPRKRDRAPASEGTSLNPRSMLDRRKRIRRSGMGRLGVGRGEWIRLF